MLKILIAMVPLEVKVNKKILEYTDNDGDQIRVSVNSTGHLSITVDGGSRSRTADLDIVNENILRDALNKRYDQKIERW